MMPPPTCSILRVSDWSTPTDCALETVPSGSTAAVKIGLESSRLVTARSARSLRVSESAATVLLLTALAASLGAVTMPSAIWFEFRIRMPWATAVPLMATISATIETISAGEGRRFMQIHHVGPAGAIPSGTPDIPSTLGRMHDDGYFDEHVAAGYDSDEGMFSPEAVEPAVDVLAELAGDGAALEFAIGTGRIALPLAARGVPVHGIELSSAMVAQLRAKPGGDAIPVTIGDMASTRVEGTFRVVYLVFNTIGNLTTQDAQVACFANAAAHLEPGGTFVIEVGVPGPAAAAARRDAGARSRSQTHKVGFDEYDVANQGLISHHIEFGGERFSMPFRYVWPAELDLMARLAGMRLERSAGRTGTARPSRARAASTSRSGAASASRGR